MSNQILTEKDLENIISNKKPGRRTKPNRLMLQVLIFVLLTTGIYILINFNSLKNNLTFWYENDYKNTPSNNSNVIVERNIAQDRKISLPEIADNSLLISDINVTAPIIWRVNNNPEEVSLGLQNGVIQINGTALPGEVGNVFITGHSSNYIWAKGNYNSIFSLLNKLVIGNHVQLKYQNTDFLYQVSDIKVVKPTEISVMGPTEDSRLTLMTCTPVGTSLNRLIVTAEQIYPSPNTNKKSSQEAQKNTLPSVR